MSNGGFNEALDVILASRDGKVNRPQIQSTLGLGEEGFFRKLGEEAYQIALACKDHKYGDGPKEDVEEESGDVLFCLLMAMVHYEVDADTVFRIMWKKREWSTTQGGFAEAFQRICDVRDGQVKDAHIKGTLRKGDDKILRKIGEEGSEVVMAAKDYTLGKGPKYHVEEEIGDVVYYMLNAMAHHEVDSDRVFSSMRRKYQFDEVPAEKPAAPRAEAIPEYPDRPLALNSAFYIERPPIELDCNQETLKPGSLVRIRGPKGMGKTSLLNRILSHASEKGLSTVRLNLERVEGGILSSLDKFLRWMSTKTTQQLQLENKLDEYWDEELVGSMESCTAYFQEYVFEQLEEPLVLGLDGVDRLFDTPEIAQDFFALMRVWHEEANNLEIWQRLRLVVIHSTEVYVPLKLNQSPFNVGMPVKLPDFSLEQIQELGDRYELDWTAADAQKLEAMVGGHPYLLQLALFQSHRGGMSLDDILSAASSPTGIYGNYLRSHLQRLQAHPELAAAFKQVVEANESVQLEPISAYKLESLGLVTVDGDTAKPSCELYRQYFSGQL